MAGDTAHWITGALLGAGAIIGIAVSSYFLMLQAVALDPADTRLPRGCRMERGECSHVIEHPDARVLGVPNALLGLVYYLVLLSAVGGLLPAPAWPWLRIAAWVSVIAGVYLTTSLLRKVRIPCPLCVTSHALNLIILILLQAR